VSDTSSNRVELHLAGAKPKVEIDGALGVVPKVLVDGKRAKSDRGGWLIALAKGGEARLTVKGWLPGFQKFRWQGEQVYQLGAQVGLAERIVMFVPFVLVVLFIKVWFVVPVALLLFLMNISVVKNTHMPRVLRIALPVINTVAATVALLAIGALING
jgi:hypothetical protein